MAQPVDRPLIAALDIGSSKVSAMIARTEVAHVWKAVAELPVKQRSVFVLRFVEEMELKEIAEMTGMNPSTVKTHLYRALAAVRASVGGGKA